MSKKDLLKIVPASPKARKFARELGVDINKVQGTERDGRVIEKDIKLFVSNKSGQNEKVHINKNEENKLEYAHSEFGEIEIKDIPRVKKISSKYLVNSWTQIPHVTNHDEADITEMEEFRNSLTDIYTGEKKKITPLAFIVKALSASLKKYPSFNSSIDEIDNGKMTFNNYTSNNITLTFFLEDADALVCSATQNRVGQVGGGSKIDYNLGWLLGFRNTSGIIAPYSTLSGLSPVDTVGPRYFLITLDDFNNNKPNKDLISLTDNKATNFKLPKYFNSQSMDSRYGPGKYEKRFQGLPGYECPDEARKPTERGSA